MLISADPDPEFTKEAASVMAEHVRQNEPEREKVWGAEHPATCRCPTSCGGEVELLDVSIAQWLKS